MNKKILFGSIFVALLFSSIPVVSNVQAHQVYQENKNIEFANPYISLDQLVELLQEIHDLLAALEGINQEFLQELQNNIYIISQGPGMSLFCQALANILDNLGEKMQELQEEQPFGWQILTASIFIVITFLYIIYDEFCLDESCGCGCSSTSSTELNSASLLLAQQMYAFPAQTITNS